MCCTRLAENTARKKTARKSPSGHHPTTLSGYIFATKACIDNCKKNLLSSNISSRCRRNVVNFGPVAAEICWRVWGTPANFNGFRVLAALLRGIPVLCISRTSWRWTEGATYIRQGDHHVGWALAHIVVIANSEWIIAIPNGTLPGHFTESQALVETLPIAVSVGSMIVTDTKPMVVQAQRYKSQTCKSVVWGLFIGWSSLSCLLRLPACVWDFNSPACCVLSFLFCVHVTSVFHQVAQHDRGLAICHLHPK